MPTDEQAERAPSDYRSFVAALFQQFGTALPPGERRSTAAAIRGEGLASLRAAAVKLWAIRRETVLVPAILAAKREQALAEIRRAAIEKRAPWPGALAALNDQNPRRGARILARMPFASTDRDLRSIFPGNPHDRRFRAAWDLAERGFLSAALADLGAKAAIRRLGKRHGSRNVTLWLRTSALPMALIEAADTVADEPRALNLSDRDLRAWLRTRAYQIATDAVLAQDERVSPAVKTVPIGQPDRPGLRVNRVGRRDPERVAPIEETLTAPESADRPKTATEVRALKLIRSMSPKDRALLTARANQEPYRDLAARLRITEGYARKRFSVLADRIRKASLRG